MSQARGQPKAAAGGEPRGRGSSGERAHIPTLLPATPAPNPEDQRPQNPHHPDLPFRPRPVGGSGVGEHASNAGRWRKAVRGGRVRERHRPKHLQVNQTSGTGPPLSPAPRPTALLACPGQAFPRLVPRRLPRKRGGRGEAGEPRCWRDEVTLKLLGKNPKMICGFEGRETRERAAAGAGGGTPTCGRRSGQRQGAWGKGCPARRPSGSAAAAAPLGLTAGPEPQRSGGGGGGLTILPHGPVPSNRHRPRCGSAGGSSLTFPAGGASARCPGPGGGGGGDVGRGKGGRKTGSAAAAGEGGGAAGAGAAAARVAVRYPQWVPVNARFSLLLSISPGG